MSGTAARHRRGRWRAPVGLENPVQPGPGLDVGDIGCVHHFDLTSAANVTLKAWAVSFPGDMIVDKTLSFEAGHVDEATAATFLPGVAYQGSVQAEGFEARLTPEASYEE